MQLSAWFDQGLKSIPIIFFIENEIQTETFWKVIPHLASGRENPPELRSLFFIFLSFFFFSVSNMDLKDAVLIDVDFPPGM